MTSGNQELKPPSLLEKERGEWVVLYAAALSGCLQSSPWKTGDKEGETSTDYVTGCAYIADAAMLQVKMRYDEPNRVLT